MGRCSLVVSVSALAFSGALLSGCGDSAPVPDGGEVVAAATDAPPTDSSSACAPDQDESSVTAEVSKEALDADAPPRTAEEAVRTYYAQDNALRAAPPLDFRPTPVDGGRSAGDFVSFSGYEPDGSYRAGYDAIRGERGRWVIIARTYCQDALEVEAPEPEPSSS